MKKWFISLLLILLCSSCGLFSRKKVEKEHIAWQDWSDAVFAKAKKENKLVLLNLEAIWCHWCHVMEKETYHDAEIASILKENYVTVKVNQDSRPDLANKYRKYGWPATIILNAQGEDLAKRAGFIEPDRMAEMLTKFAKNPVAEQPKKNVTYSKNAFLSRELSKKLYRRHILGYDAKHGGLKIKQKFIDADTVEYALFHASKGDIQNARIASHTLESGRHLIDFVWGGAYQYSTHSDWEHPHYEKIMSTQVSYIRSYALGYAIFQEAVQLRFPNFIYTYLLNFLSDPEGGFYTSQDADVIPGEDSKEYFELGDKERRKKGIPRVDKSIYSRENGWAIEAITLLHCVTGKKKFLKRAIKASNWILANRALADGGFAHGENDTAGPFLGDTLAMGRAFLMLYVATAERQWLDRAKKAADFIGKHFKDKQNAGYTTASLVTKSVLRPVPQLDENIRMARFANLLYRYCREEKYKKLAAHAMRYLATPDVALARFSDPGILLADLEIANEPLHITIVGAKDNKEAQKLHKAALKHGAIYKMVEWLDHREGPLPGSTIPYPKLDKPAAFICSENRCSSPQFSVKELESFLKEEKKNTLVTEKNKDK